MSTAVIDIPVVSTIRVSVTVEDQYPVPGVEEIIKERVEALVGALARPIEIGDIPEGIKRVVNDAAGDGTLRKRGRKAKQEVSTETEAEAPVEATAPVDVDPESTEATEEVPPCVSTEEITKTPVDVPAEAINRALQLSDIIKVGDHIIRSLPWQPGMKHEPVKVTEVHTSSIETAKGTVSFAALNEKYEIVNSEPQTISTQDEPVPASIPASIPDSIPDAMPEADATQEDQPAVLSESEASFLDSIDNEPTIDAASVEIPEDPFGPASTDDAFDSDDIAPPAEVVGNLPLSECLQIGDRVIQTGTGKEFIIGDGSTSECFNLCDDDGVRVLSVLAFMMNTHYARAAQGAAA